MSWNKKEEIHHTGLLINTHNSIRTNLKMRGINLRNK